MTANEIKDFYGIDLRKVRGYRREAIIAGAELGTISAEDMTYMLTASENDCARLLMRRRLEKAKKEDAN